MLIYLPLTSLGVVSDKNVKDIGPMKPHISPKAALRINSS